MEEAIDWKLFFPHPHKTTREGNNEVVWTGRSLEKASQSGPGRWTSLAGRSTRQLVEDAFRINIEDVLNQLHIYQGGSNCLLHFSFLCYLLAGSLAVTTSSWWSIFAGKTVQSLYLCSFQNWKVPEVLAVQYKKHIPHVPRNICIYLSTDDFCAPRNVNKLVMKEQGLLQQPVIIVVCW
jgi:hypothetical protein